MDVWLIEPYFTGSHQAWAQGYQAHSQHTVRLLTLPGRFWKWRMQGGSITLARQARALEGKPQLLLVSDMLNLPVFLSLCGVQLAHVPVAIYFHENQLTYPLPPGERRDLNYGLINVASALCSDALFFNSDYHFGAFFDELPRLLRHFPDYNELWIVPALRARAQVLPLGLDLARLEATQPEPTSTPPAPATAIPNRSEEGGPELPSDANRRRPLILWNHRWEYDKDPDTFFRAIYTLADEELDFGLILLGESFRNQPEEFLDARRRLSGRLIHFGYAQDTATYSRLLWQADIVVSTARHEFFGAAIVEACYCNCFPILPRRLSYHELLPVTYHAACLYDDFNGLLERLRRALLDPDATRAFSLQDHMRRFDWQSLAPSYDQRLAQIAAQGQHIPLVG